MPDPTGQRERQIADALGAVYNARVQLMAAARLADEAHHPALHARLLDIVDRVDTCSDVAKVDE